MGADTSGIFVLPVQLHMLDTHTTVEQYSAIKKLASYTFGFNQCL